MWGSLNHVLFSTSPHPLLLKFKEETPKISFGRHLQCKWPRYDVHERQPEEERVRLCEMSTEPKGSPTDRQVQ